MQLSCLRGLMLARWKDLSPQQQLPIFITIVRRAAGTKETLDAITQALTDLHICAVERTILEQAIALDFRDFEDVVQCACARGANHET